MKLVQLTDNKVREIVNDELKMASPQWISEITGSISNVITNFKSEIMTKLDKVMGELEKIRSEQTIISDSQTKHQETLEIHNKRIQNLEHPTVAS